MITGPCGQAVTKDLISQNQHLQRKDWFETSNGRNIILSLPAGYIIPTVNQRGKIKYLPILHHPCYFDQPIIYPQKHLMKVFQNVIQQRNPSDREPVRLLGFADVPFESITLPKWYPSPSGVKHKMSYLTADENCLYQCSHTSSTPSPTILFLTGRGAREEGSIIFALKVSNMENKHQWHVLEITVPIDLKC